MAKTLIVSIMKVYEKQLDELKKYRLRRLVIIMKDKR